MRYDLALETVYEYTATVSHSRHVLRMLPIDRPHQRVLAAELDIKPGASERSEATDFFGNHVTHARVSSPHARLRLRATATVEVTAPEPLDETATPAFETVSADAFAASDIGPDSPVHFLFASRAIPLSPVLTAYAAQDFSAGRPVLAGATALMARIKREFTFDPKATDTTTPPLVAFKARRGVCQDLANVMIAGLRGLGLPAAYVSGYIRTIPPKGQPRRIGADATHAWVAVWCGAEAGWVGLDPTNALRIAEDHIVLAIGRDYSDVAPVDGVIRAAGGHQLKVAVDVVPVEAGASR